MTYQCGFGQIILSNGFISKSQTETDRYGKIFGGQLAKPCGPRDEEAQVHNYWCVS